MNRAILRIALPAIISNITTPLLGLVDTAVTGHLGAVAYIGAIAVGGTMFSMVYWVMNFLRMGSSGITAQAYGAGDDAVTLGVLRLGMMIALCVSVCMVAVSPWLADVLLRLMETDAETTALARRYFTIVIFGAPAVLGGFALTGWMIGMQDSRSPMWMALVTNVVNIAVSIGLVYGAGMRIEGIALGTVSAQWTGFAAGLWMASRVLRRRGSSLWAVCRGIGVSQPGAGRFMRVNTDIFLRTLCLVAVTTMFTRTGAEMGQAVLAANALLMQLFILFSYFMDGFAFSGEALAGRFRGAGDHAALRAVVRGVFGWGAAVVVVFTLVYLAGGQWIIALLTDDYGVRLTAGTYVGWAVSVPVAGVAAFVWDGVFIGLTLTRAMLVSMLVSMLLFFAGCRWLVPAMGNHGLWLSFIIYLSARGIIQTLWARRWLRRHHVGKICRALCVAAVLAMPARAGASGFDIDSLRADSKVVDFIVGSALWVDDTFNSFDTTYVEKYPYYFTIWPVSEGWSDSYDFRMPGGDKLNMGTKPFQTIGVKLDCTFFSFGYNKSLGKYGNGRSLWTIGLCTNFFELNLRRAINRGGTIIHSVVSDGEYTRVDLPFSGLHTKAMYVEGAFYFNPYRYSHAAVFTLGKIQRKSSGSPYVGLRFEHHRVDLNLLPLLEDVVDPEQYEEYQGYDYLKTTLYFNNYFATIGYGYNLVLPHGWVLGVSNGFSFGGSYGWSNGDDGQLHFGMADRLRISAGWNRPRVFVNISASADMCLYREADYRLRNALYTFSVSAGWRFNPW